MGQKYYYLDRDWYDKAAHKIYGDMAWTFCDSEYLPITDYKDEEGF